MSDPMIKRLSSNDFNVEKFVKELSQHCVGGLELQQKRVEIGALAEETNSLLKKNVFHNYMLFIETAKEISHLEGEMYQLSHLLTEQRSLLATLAHSSIVEGVAPLNTSVNNTTVEQDKETQTRKQLSDIMQKMEGCVPLLDSSRAFIMEGDLTELDPLDNKPLRRVHAYLLSDMLILACPIQGDQGRYQMNTCYDNLTSLAVVNIRHIAAAFKLLAFPDTRVFQAPSASVKKEWLDKFEEIKKSSKEQNSSLPKPVQGDSSGNPFEDEDEEEEEEEEVEEEEDGGSETCTDSMELDDFVKIILLGAPGVGKTSIIQQFVWTSFDKEYYPTQRKHTYYPTIIRNETYYGLKITDLPCIPYFPIDSYMEWTDFRFYGLRQATAYILVFDLSKANIDSTFQYIKSMRDQILESRAKDIDKVTLMVVGNKLDLMPNLDQVLNKDLHKSSSNHQSLFTTVTSSLNGSQQRVLTRQNIINLVKKHWRCPYMECSAKYNYKLNLTFKDLMDTIEANCRRAAANKEAAGGARDRRRGGGLLTAFQGRNCDTGRNTEGDSGRNCHIL
uniref:Exocyst complex component 8 n=1 Tax=Cacopsylla melanoneura TaxID=428564 RepID=A0A8D8ZTN9_9HEMI